jgi:phosphate transport system permease protein
MLLAASRAAGDTATVFLTAGGSMFWFQSFNTPTAAMTPFIFNNFGSSFLNLRTDAWGAALVLLIIMLVISLGARLAVPSPTEAAEGS